MANDPAFGAAIEIARSILVQDPATTAGEILDFVEQIHEALTRVQRAAGDIAPAVGRFGPSTLIARTIAQGQPLADPQEMAVLVRQTVTRDGIICLEDGRHLKMLKRHLRDQFGMSPEQYRAKWNLPNDYPMTTPDYLRQKSTLSSALFGGKK
nr:MucR family transcriptional regulator [uncultured Rhodopila sp.]